MKLKGPYHSARIEHLDKVVRQLGKVSGLSAVRVADIIGDKGSRGNPRVVIKPINDSQAKLEVQTDAMQILYIEPGSKDILNKVKTALQRLKNWDIVGTWKPSIAQTEVGKLVVKCAPVEWNIYKKLVEGVLSGAEWSGYEGNIPFIKSLPSVVRKIGKSPDWAVKFRKKGLFKAPEPTTKNLKRRPGYKSYFQPAQVINKETEEMIEFTEDQGFILPGMPAIPKTPKVPSKPPTRAPIDESIALAKKLALTKSGILKGEADLRKQIDQLKKEIEDKEMEILVCEEAIGHLNNIIEQRHLFQALTVN